MSQANMIHQVLKPQLVTMPGDFAYTATIESSTRPTMDTTTRRPILNSKVEAFGPAVAVRLFRKANVMVR